MLRRRKQKSDTNQRRSIGRSQKRKSKVELPILITENKIAKLLLGLVWLVKLEIGLEGSRNTNIIRNTTMDEKSTEIVNDITIHIPVRTSRILLVRFLSNQSANIFFWKFYTCHTLRALIGRYAS